ncbi:MAG TPA: hypothetical protein VGC16_06355 [Rhizomicrobium sp.]
MRRLAILLAILVIGAAILAPAIMMFEPDPLPGDFTLALGAQHYAVPVLWSLCASGGLALLYSLFRR